MEYSGKRTHVELLNNERDGGEELLLTERNEENIGSNVGVWEYHR